MPERRGLPEEQVRGHGCVLDDVEDALPQQLRPVDRDPRPHAGVHGLPLWRARQGVRGQG